MRGLLVILTIITAAAGIACLVAGTSLIVRTTRSPVARVICRLILGIETDDFHDYVERLFEARARDPGGPGGMTVERYRRSLRVAGVAAIVLGVMLLAFLAFAFTLLLRNMP